MCKCVLDKGQTGQFPPHSGREIRLTNPVAYPKAFEMVSVTNYGRVMPD